MWNPKLVFIVGVIIGIIITIFITNLIRSKIEIKQIFIKSKIMSILDNNMLSRSEQKIEILKVCRENGNVDIEYVKGVYLILNN